MPGDRLFLGLGKVERSVHHAEQCLEGVIAGECLQSAPRVALGQGEMVRDRRLDQFP